MEILHRYNNTQCFRLRIRKSDYEKILDPGFWPAGISVRRFWHRRAKRENNNGVSGTRGGGGSGGGGVGGGGGGVSAGDKPDRSVGGDAHEGGDDLAARTPPIVAPEASTDGLVEATAETAGSSADATAVKTPPTPTNQ